MRFCAYLCAGYGVAASVALLWHFSNIIRFGQHLIQEPNKVVLAGEVVFITLCALFCITVAVLLLKEEMKRGKDKVQD